ncbi:hypothetical protein [Methylobacterium nigriterrae]|uniref:hypothetical protein n=1 Tax=Methylobacterium nigriterrae TaxID=3127512 RepID=UPI003013382C
MRSVVTLLGLMLAVTSGAEAKPKPRPASVPSQTIPADRALQQKIEQKSAQALREEQQREARFDVAVRKATNSICAGCLEVAGSPTKERVRHIVGRAGVE